MLTAFCGRKQTAPKARETIELVFDHPGYIDVARLDLEGFAS